jgi:hypothetical protein
MQVNRNFPSLGIYAHEIACGRGKYRNLRNIQLEKFPQPGAVQGMKPNAFLSSRPGNSERLPVYEL